MQITFTRLFLGNFFSLDANGNWHTAGNWNNNSAPDGVGEQASVPSNNTSARVVTLNNAATLGKLILVSEGFSNTVGNSNRTLTFEVASGTAQVFFSGSADSIISSDIALNSDLDVIHASNSGVAVLAQQKLNASGKRISKYGVGAVAIDGGGLNVGDNDNYWVGGYLTIKEGAVHIRYGAKSLGWNTGPTVELYLGSLAANNQLYLTNMPAYPSTVTIPNSFAFKRGDDSTKIGLINVSGIPVAGHVFYFTGAWTGDLNPSGYNNLKAITLRGTNSYHPIASRGFFLQNDLSGLTSFGSSDAIRLYSQAGGPVKFDTGITFPTNLYLIAGFKDGTADSYGDSGFVANFNTTVPASVTELETSNSSNLSTTPVIGVSHSSGTTTWQGTVKVNANNGSTKTSAMLHSEGTSLCEFSGAFTSSGNYASYQPLIKTGTGNVKLSNSASSFANGTVIVREGGLIVSGNLTSSTTAVNVGTPITKVNLSTSLTSGDTIRITVNGTTYTQAYNSTSDNTLRLLAIQVSKDSNVAVAYVTLVSNDFTDSDEREIVLIPMSVTGFASISSARTGTGTARFTSTTSYADAFLYGTGSIAGPVNVADQNTAAIYPTDPITGTVGTLSVGNLTLKNASYIYIDFDNGVNGKIQVNGNLTLDGAVDFNDSAYLVPGTYDIITYTGNLIANNSLQVGYVGNGLSASIVVDTNAKKVQAVIS